MGCDSHGHAFRALLVAKAACLSEGSLEEINGYAGRRAHTPRLIQACKPIPDGVKEGSGFLDMWKMATMLEDDEL